eukprot:IDg11139t1
MVSIIFSCSNKKSARQVRVRECICRAGQVEKDDWFVEGRGFGALGAARVDESKIQLDIRAPFKGTYKQVKNASRRASRIIWGKENTERLSSRVTYEVAPLVEAVPETYVAGGRDMRIKPCKIRVVGSQLTSALYGLERQSIGDEPGEPDTEKRVWRLDYLCRDSKS